MAARADSSPVRRRRELPAVVAAGAGRACWTGAGVTAAWLATAAEAARAGAGAGRGDGGAGRAAAGPAGATPSAPPLPGRKASMRSSVMVKPAYSSGARPISLRPCTAIW